MTGMFASGKMQKNQCSRKTKQVIGLIFSRFLVYIDKYIDVSCLEDINT